MSYTIMWPDWESKTSQVVDEFREVIPAEAWQLTGELAETLGDTLRSEFPDLDPAIVGWVAIRLASHLGAAVGHANGSGDEIPGAWLALIGLRAGRHLVEVAGD